MNAYKDLESRNFIYQVTNAKLAEDILQKEKVTFYVGFDPTGDSLHIGHLLPIMAMKRLQEAGHIPIVLVGGATGLVGDPSGKQDARPILTKDDVNRNVEALKSQLSRFINIDDGNAIFVNNADWFQDMKYLDFLREVGSRFSINKMLTAESVKLRLETGLSFLEFNYMLLQAYDFYVLNKKYNCLIELGGQDQWGNIVAGVDLVRRMSQKEVYGVTFPLLLNSNGEKFGKTAGNAIWLDKNKTSEFEYYQFWRNTEDCDVERLLGFFTSLPMDEIVELGKLPAPAINRAKEILAYEATALAHGKYVAEKAYLAACSKFGFADKDGKIFTSSDIAKIANSDAESNLPTYQLSETDLEEGNIWIIKLLSLSGLCNSNGDARRLVQGGGAYVNDERVSDVSKQISIDDFKDNAIILKAGKKKIKRIIL